MNENELKAKIAAMPRSEVNAEIFHLTNEQYEYEEELKTLRAQLATLKAQSIDQALLVERYRACLDRLADREGQVNIEYPTGVNWMTIGEFVSQTLSPSPQTAIGVKALELVSWELKCNKYADAYVEAVLNKDKALQRELLDKAREAEERKAQAAASFTKEELIQLGVG